MIINSRDITESGINAFNLTFSSAAADSFNLPVEPLNRKTASAYLKLLGDNLTVLSNWQTY